MKEFGRTGVKVTAIAQGGARMDLFPDIPSAAAHVRRVYEMDVTYFDCAHSYWGGKSEEAYGMGCLRFARISSSQPSPVSAPGRKPKTSFTFP